MSAAVCGPPQWSSAESAQKQRCPSLCSLSLSLSPPLPPPLPCPIKYAPTNTRDCLKPSPRGGAASCCSTRAAKEFSTHCCTSTAAVLPVAWQAPRLPCQLPGAVTGPRVLDHDCLHDGPQGLEQFVTSTERHPFRCCETWLPSLLLPRSSPDSLPEAPERSQRPRAWANPAMDCAHRAPAYLRYRRPSPSAPGLRRPELERPRGRRLELDGARSAKYFEMLRA